METLTEKMYYRFEIIKNGRSPCGHILSLTAWKFGNVAFADYTLKKIFFSFRLGITYLGMLIFDFTIFGWQIQFLDPFLQTNLTFYGLVDSRNNYYKAFTIFLGPSWL
jgi:hypothetical protein